MNASYDVLVVGGGVAGYAAAISLATSGQRVAVLDKDIAGPTSLGESLDWETPRMLDQLGIDCDELLERDEATFKRGAVASHSVIAGRVSIGFHPIYRVLMALVGRSRDTYHVRRSAMSRALVDRAKEVGVSLIETRVVEVHTAGDRISELVDETGQTFVADHYIDATGRARVLARELGIGAQTIGPAKLALSARMTHTYDNRGTRIRLDDSRPHPTWIWDINTGVDATDVGVVFAACDVAQERRAGTTIPELYRTELARHDDLQWALEQFPEADELERTAFQDQVSDRLVGENWMLAGQAAAVIDPLLSSGMSFAFRSGLSAADATQARCGRHGRRTWPAIRHDRLLRSYALTVNTLLNELWYESRLRDVHGLAVNVLLLLVCNFNLNHLQARWFTQTRTGSAAVVRLHRAVRSAIPAMFRSLESMSWSGSRRGNHKFVTIARSGQ